MLIRYMNIQELDSLDASERVKELKDALDMIGDASDESNGEYKIFIHIIFKIFLN